MAVARKTRPISAPASISIRQLLVEKISPAKADKLATRDVNEKKKGACQELSFAWFLLWFRFMEYKCGIAQKQEYHWLGWSASNMKSPLSVKTKIR